MEQRIVKKAGNLESLKYFFKLAGAFSVIYLNLCQTRCENCLKFKKENPTATYPICKKGNAVSWVCSARQEWCVFGVTRRVRDGCACRSVYSEQEREALVLLVVFLYMSLF